MKKLAICAVLAMIAIDLQAAVVPLPGLTNGEIIDIKMRNRENFVPFAFGAGGTIVTGDAPAGIYIWEVEATTVYGIYIRRAGPVSLIR